MLRERLYIASDHAGYELKTKLCAFFKEVQIPFIDLGTNDEKSCDYPDFAHLLTSKIDEKSFGILICGSGIGISIAANRHKNIRCALCSESLSARLARKHNDANVLSMPGRFVTNEEALEIVRTFLSTAYEGGRHQRRIDKIPVK